MADKARPGQPLSLSASSWNSMIDLLQLPLDAAEPASRQPRNCSTIMVKNNESDIMKVGCPVKIGAFTIGDVPEFSIAINDGGYFAATFASSVLTLPACAVCIEPIIANGFGLVAIGGIVWAKVTGSSDGNYIDTLPSADSERKTHWRYSDAGPHRVLGRTTNGAMVSLGQSSWCVVARTPSTAVLCGTSGLCDLRHVSSSSGAISSTSYQKEIFNMGNGGTAIKPSTQIFAMPFGDKYFACDPATAVYRTANKLVYDTLGTSENLIANLTACSSTTTCGTSTYTVSVVSGVLTWVRTVNGCTGGCSDSAPTIPATVIGQTMTVKCA